MKSPLCPLNAAFCLCLHVKELRALLCITEIEERVRAKERERPTDRRIVCVCGGGVIHSQLLLYQQTHTNTFFFDVCMHFPHLLSTLL